jgi:hypothetical protein
MAVNTSRPDAPFELSDRERGWNHGGARMQRGIRMGVVEIERMTERAVEQGRDRGRPRLRVAEHGGFALAAERERLEHFQKRRRGFRVAPCPNRAAEKIQRQDLGALQHFPRDILEFQVCDVGGQRCGFISHGVVSRIIVCDGFGTALAARRQHRPRRHKRAGRPRFGH